MSEDPLFGFREFPFGKQIETDLLISEIRKRPKLYDKKLEVSDSEKRKIWEEVYSIVIRDWDSLSEWEKPVRANVIRTKWKNLKDNFARELSMELKCRSNPGAKKKKLYVHFKSLLFLLPIFEEKYSVKITLDDFYYTNKNSDTPPDAKTNQNVKVSSLSDVTTDKAQEKRITEKETPAESRKTEKGTPVEKRKTETETPPESSSSNYSRRKKKAKHMNEDKHFVSMLVTMFENLNNDQKHFARIEILNVMRNAKYFQPQPRQHLMMLPDAGTTHSYSSFDENMLKLLQGHTNNQHQMQQRQDFECDSTENSLSQFSSSDSESF